MWLSLVERCVRDAEVAGSNPVIPTNKKGRLFGVLFCWSAGERILFCRLNTPCPNRTRKTTLTVFFHTFFPSVGDKPAQKSLGVLFCWSARERLLYCRSNTPCHNQTRKTTLTVFFHTIFPSVGDKPAQKSLVSFFVGLLGSVSFIADQTPPAIIERERQP